MRSASTRARNSGPAADELDVLVVKTRLWNLERQVEGTYLHQCEYPIRAARRARGAGQASRAAGAVGTSRRLAQDNQFDRLLTTRAVMWRTQDEKTFCSAGIPLLGSSS